MFGLLFDLFNLTISVCLPLLATYKAVKQHDNALLATSRSDLKPWCLYWLVYALFATLEAHLGFILQYLPFFSLVKLYLSLWLILPQTQGAQYVYYVYIDPFITEHQVAVENILRCTDPRELLRVVSNYFGMEINLSRFATAPGHTTVATPVSNISYLDQFAESFVKSPAVGHGSASLVGEGGLVESLLGVIKALPLGNKSSSQESFGAKSMTTTPQKSSESLRSFESSPGATKSSSSEGSDFDVVGKEELANFVDNVTKGISSLGSTDNSSGQSSGWFGWWSQGKSKTA